MEEGRMFRLLGNVLEIEFNMTQLEGSVPPESAAARWKKVVKALREDVDALSDNVTVDGSPQDVRGLASDAKRSIKKANAYLASYEKALEE